MARFGVVIRTVVLVPVALGALTASTPARGDVFLLKDGARVYGWLDREYVDEHAQKWLSIRASFGHVDVKASVLRKHLKSKKADGALQLDEARFVEIAGDVRKSDDGGKTWTRVVMSADADDTSDGAVFPPVLRAGERLRTGESSRAELDLGFGPARVAADAELELVADAAATVRVLRGALGASLDDLPKDAEFRVETPQASMGVRGTFFYVRVGEGSRFGVERGSVVVRVGDEVVAIGEGEAVAVAADGKIEHDTPDEDPDDVLVGLDDAFVYPRLEWVVVPGGRFEMGGDVGRAYRQNRPYEPGPPKRIRLSSFLMARQELTRAVQARCAAWIRERGPAGLSREGRIVPPPRPGPLKPWLGAPADDEPATMNWVSANIVARWLGARLPSEAEWEYACRGGEKKRYGFGERFEEECAEYEWVLHSSGDEQLSVGDVDAFQAKYGMRNFPGYGELLQENGCRPHPVGELKPSPAGLFDMLGNVREWCADAAKETLEETPTDGSPVPGDDTARRVGRGADWESAAFFDAHHRNGHSPFVSLGVRLVRELR